MLRPPPDPRCADRAPTASVPTPYDYEHLITYLRVLDADADRADWQEVARIVLHIDPSRERARAWRCWESQPRARQMDDQARLPAPDTRSRS
jgi:hypothetical protein